MKRTLTWPAMAVLTAVLSTPATAAAALSAVSAKMHLKVLYVGGSGETAITPGKPLEGAEVQRRMAAFAGLLRRHFTEVTVMHARDYRQEVSAGYDVTVMDGTPEPLEPLQEIRDESGRLLERLAARYFTEDFDRPMLLIAELGATLGRRVGLKFDWYCLCLDAHAHHLRTDHPIFHGPFPVKLTLRERPTPEAAFHYEYFRETPTPASLPMWRVQTKGYRTDEGFRVGMVARPWGFEDSPDAEYISSGVCTKGLDAVALGRHGNFFGWGFAASPDHMTEEAQTVFANAVAYISRFAGQAPIARKYHDRRATKAFIKELKYFASRAAYDRRLERTRGFTREMLAAKQAAATKQARGEALSAEEKRALEYQPAPEEPWENFLRGRMGELFEIFGTDTAAYQRYFDANYDYFYSVAPIYKLVVDEDVKSLGIPNTDMRLLDRAIELWERGRDVAKARRILTRYTLLDFQTPQEWRGWFERNRGRLFFTQAGGFVFLVDSRGPQVQGNDYARDGDFPAGRRLRAAAAPVSEPETTDELNPVTIAAGLSEGPHGKALVVKFRIHPGFHVYSHVAPEDPFVALKLAIELPEGYSMVGELSSPPFEPYNAGGTGVYTGQVAFSQDIAGSGAGTAKVAVTYQTCDAHICLPPTTRELTVALL